jgi:hypothetical protein
MGKGALIAGPSGRGRPILAHLLSYFRFSTMRLLMRRPRAARGRIRVLISFLVLASPLAGCGSQATETPSEIPDAPKESSKASYEAFFKKAAPKPAAPTK